MPTHMLLRVAWQFEDLNPKNQAVINPCFRRQLDITDPTSGTDAQQLCDDLAAAMSTYTVPGSKLITVKAYNLQGTPPNYPMASKTVGTTPTPIQGIPQQSAVLSFYSGQNIPRKRGRLYLPAFVLTTSTAELASARASSTIRTKLGALVTAFASLGGANVDWIVWSRANHTAAKVDNWWASESWAVIRSRKLAANTRTTGTTSG